MTRVRASAPGRVNLIGDHTDYAGGLALPLAIDLATTVEGDRGGREIRLRSRELGTEVVCSLDHPLDDVAPDHWGRYVAGVAAELRPDQGFVGEVSSTVPVGSGLSSSAALEVAVALALGADGTPLALAQLCQRAEHVATGVPCGIMDQLTSTAGVAGHALLVDFSDLSTIEPVPIPERAEIVVVHSGEPRRLAGSAYASRRAECEAAEEALGRPLRGASVEDAESLHDDRLRRRARHVTSENARVRQAAAALREDDLATAGVLMRASHASLRDDYEVSTPVLDALVERLGARPGVHGVRLTGAGFGGCVVALTDRGALDEGWTVRASDGASVSPAPRGASPSGTRTRRR